MQNCKMPAVHVDFAKRNDEFRLNQPSKFILTCWNSLEVDNRLTRQH